MAIQTRLLRNMFAFGFCYFCDATFAKKNNENTEKSSQDARTNLMCDPSVVSSSFRSAIYLGIHQGIRLQAQL